MEKRKLDDAIHRKNALRRKQLLDEAIAESDKSGSKGNLSHRWATILKENP